VPGTSKGAATAPQGGAQSPTPAAPPPPPPDGPAQLVTQQWARFWNTQAIEALVGLYAKDGEFYPTSGERVTGQAALRSLFQGALAANRPVITMTSVSGGHSGNVAYDAGDYVEIITRKSSGLAFPVTGRYLIVCRQAPNGHWVISQQMWTEEPKGK
jgi:ketosteroid isomerase-like protein